MHRRAVSRLALQFILGLLLWCSPVSAAGETKSEDVVRVIAPRGEQVGSTRQIGGANRPTNCAEGGSRCGDHVEDATRAIEPRAPHVDDATWDHAVAQGGMSLDIWQAGLGQPSPFVDFDELDKWGWHKTALRVVDPRRAKDLGVLAEKVSRGHTLARQGIAREGQTWSHSGWDGSQSHVRTVDGVLCKATEAEYTFYLSIDNDHAVFVVDEMVSPEQKMREWPAAGQAMYSRPRLSTWSDVAFLVWRKAWGRVARTSALDWVVKAAPLDQATLDVVLELLGPNWPIGLAPWPSIHFPADSEQGKVLLGTALGQTVAALLLAHQQAFSRRFVDSISVFALGAQTLNPAEICLGFHTGGSSAPSPVTEHSDDQSMASPKLSNGPGNSEAQMSPNVEVSSTRGKKRPCPDSEQRCPLPSKQQRFSEPVDWEVAVMAGQCTLQLRKDNAFPQSSLQEYSDLKKWGWNRLGSQPDTAAIYSYVKPAFTNLRYSLSYRHTTRETWRQSGWGASRTLSKYIDGQWYNAKGLWYDQLMNVDNGIIVRNMASRQPYSSRQGTDRPVTGTAPQDLHFSAESRDCTPLWTWTDVACLVWQELSRARTLPSGLNWVFIVDISDQATLSIIDSILRSVEEVMHSWPGLSLNVDEQAGMALLSSPLVHDVVALLLGHREAFGDSFIQTFHVYNGATDASENPVHCIAVQLSKDTQRDERLAPGSVAASKVSGQSRSWDSAKENGRALITVWEKGTTAQSTFMNIEQLAQYGWTLRDDTGDVRKSASLSAVLAPLKYLDIYNPKDPYTDAIWLRPGQGIDKAAICYLIMHAGHGVIKKGKIANNVVEPAIETSTNDQPELRSWEDVAALAWQAHRNTYRGREHSLEWVFGGRVEDPYLESLVNEALGVGPTTVPEWPGISFDMSTSEGQALLGSRLGEQVATMLMSHKELFSGMFINRIVLYDAGKPGRIWFTKLPCIAFHISEEPTDPW